MLCNICHRQASFLCCNQHHCPTHFGLHFQIRCAHNPKQVLITLLPLEQKMLKSELSLRITKLENIKSQLMTTAKVIIDWNIENLKKINQIISNYTQIINSSTFQVNQIQEIYKIIKSSMKIKRFKSNELYESIQECLDNDLISFENDPLKERLLIRNQFLTTHNGGFKCLALSENEEKIVTGSEDTTVRVWDLTQKIQLACFSEHRGVVRSVAVSKDCSLALSGSDDKTVILWDVKRTCLKKVLKAHSENVYSVAFTFDEKLILSGSISEEIFIWSLKTFEVVYNIRVLGGIWSLLGVSQNEFVFVCGRQIETFDLIDFKTKKSITAHDLAIWSIAKTKNSQLLITGSGDCLVKIWDGLSLNLNAVLSGHKSQVRSVCVTSCDSYIVSGSDDKTIILWSIESKSAIHTFKHHSDYISGVASINDSIYSVSRDSHIGITSLSTPKFKSFISLTPFYVDSESYEEDSLAVGSKSDVLVWHSNQSVASLKGHKGVVITCCLNMKKDLLISGSTGSDNNLILWDLKKMTMLGFLKGHENTVVCVDISYDGFNAISGDTQGVVWYWDLIQRKQKFLLEGQDKIVHTVKIMNNKKFAASAGTDLKVYVWDIEGGNIFAVLNGHKYDVGKVLFTDDDCFIVSANSFEGIKVWNLDERKIAFEFQDLEKAEEWLSLNRNVQVEFMKFLF